MIQFGLKRDAHSKPVLTEGFWKCRGAWIRKVVRNGDDGTDTCGSGSCQDVVETHFDNGRRGAGS